MLELARKATPVKRVGAPEEIARTILFLASDRNDFISGQVLGVDGGMPLWGDIWQIPEPSGPVGAAEEAGPRSRPAGEEAGPRSRPAGEEARSAFAARWRRGARRSRPAGEEAGPRSRPAGEEARSAFAARLASDDGFGERRRRRHQGRGARRRRSLAGLDSIAQARAPPPAAAATVDEARAASAAGARSAATLRGVPVSAASAEIALKETAPDPRPDRRVRFATAVDLAGGPELGSTALSAEAKATTLPFGTRSLSEPPRAAALELVDHEPSPVPAAEPEPVPESEPEPEFEPEPVAAEPPASVPPPLLIPVDSVRPSRPPSFPSFGSENEPFRPSVVHRIEAWGRQYFLNSRFSFVRALGPMMAVALVLFTRWPGTNYIFDEQEALLANPYVNGTNGLRFIDAIHRDFWGLPADRSVGSYRPIPNFLWRVLWHISHAPFFHHLYNVALHGVNAALLAWIVYAWTKRRGLAYLAGFVFVTCAVLTEAVCGLVGIADVLGGLGALLALAALSLPGWAMPFVVFASVLFGLFSKESALVCVPLVPLAALLVAPLTHPERPARVFRAGLALVASAAAFVLYVELRKQWFPSPLPSDLQAALPVDASAAKRWMHAFLVWFHQAPLPKDPLNNPLAEADVSHRVAGAFRVYWRGILQMIVPTRLSGDYSFPQEPIPDTIYLHEFTRDHWFSESIAGAAMMILPPVATVVLWFVALKREPRARRLAREGLADRLDAFARESDPDSTFDGYEAADDGDPARRRVRPGSPRLRRRAYVVGRRARGGRPPRPQEIVPRRAARARRVAAFAPRRRDDRRRLAPRSRSRIRRARRFRSRASRRSSSRSA